MIFNADDPASAEPAIDFAMMPYEPPMPASRGALSSAAVLAASTDGAVAGSEMRAVAVAVRAAFGYGRTIWSAALTAEGLGWELYWYKKRKCSVVSANDLRIALGGLMEFDLPDDLPSHPDVFSIDPGPDQLSGRRAVDHLNIYSANPASTVQSGACHRFDSSGATLTAIYHRFPADCHQAALQQSDAAIHLRGREFRADLLPCTSIHVASKARRDAVYYGGITADQLVDFLTHSPFESRFASAVETRAKHLGHLQFDVGTDFELHQVEPVKLAVYGVL